MNHDGIGIGNFVIMPKTKTTRTIRNAYQCSDGVSRKPGRPRKKLKPAQIAKLKREEEAAAREAQISKLRSSTNDDDGICETSSPVTTISETKRECTTSLKKSKVAQSAPRTRSKSQPSRPTRNTSAPELFVAQPATPTKASQDPWRPSKKKIEHLKKDVKRLGASNKYYKQLSMEQYKEIRELNSQLMFCDLPEDRPPHELDGPPSQPPRQYTGDDTKAFVTRIMKGYNASTEELESLFMGLGLDRNGHPSARLSKDERKEKLTTGIRTLLDLNFGKCTRGDDGKRCSCG